MALEAAVRPVPNTIQLEQCFFLFCIVPSRKTLDSQFYTANSVLSVGELSVANPNFAYICSYLPKKTKLNHFGLASHIGKDIFFFFFP